MAECGLHDIHYNTRFYTWNNKQVGTRRVLSKIEWVLGNNAWNERFPTALVSFLPKGDYDRLPMVIYFSKSHRGMKPFRFYNYWDVHLEGSHSYVISQKLRMLKS